MIALLLAAAIWPPWQTVAQGTSLQTLDFRQKAFIAGTFVAAARFTPYLRDEDKAAVARVHFAHIVLVAALSTSPDTCGLLEIVNLRRSRQTLTVSAVMHLRPLDPHLGCLFTEARPYHVISVPRRVIGTPLPRRVVLKQQLADPWP